VRSTPGGGDTSLRLPLARNVHTYHSFFRCHPTGNPTLCTMCSSARRLLPGCYETRYQGLGTMGQDRSTCTPHLVVLITTGSRSVFRRERNTGPSRRYHKRELRSHTSVTSSCDLKTHAREGRSTQKGKVVSKLDSSAFSSSSILVCPKERPDGERAKAALFGRFIESSRRYCRAAFDF